MQETVTPDELEKLLNGANPPRILDVRRFADRREDPTVLPGAEWKDPEKAAEWGRELGSGEVVIYCVRGGSVSRFVQDVLRKQDVPVKYIEGGLEAWKRSGRPVGTII